MIRTWMLTILLGLLSASVMAYNHNHNRKIIIDTDAGLDDLRAICMLMASDKLEILGITTSDGMCDPQTGYQKVTSLLQSLGHEGVRVCPGNLSEGKVKPYGDLCYAFQWGIKTSPHSLPSMKADELLISIMARLQDSITLIALGPLTNYARMLDQEPALATRITRIIWYNEGIDPVRGDNLMFDPVSYEKVLTYRISIDIIHSSPGEELVLDPELLAGIGNSSSPYAKAVHSAFSDTLVHDEVNARHLGLWDDLVSIFFVFPEAFALKQTEELLPVRLYIPVSIQEVRQKWLRIFSFEHDDSQVLDHFPADPGFFAEDIRGIVDRIIRAHGLEEWRAGVLTNELHRHLGAYAIIGTKMGLRAREYFRAGHDQLKVVSYAGSIPPVSCLNDGLQVSTGATLGHGLIRIAEVVTSEPVPPSRISTSRSP
ncbi:MAG: nucleoside hydrolase [Bacteroidales bacterium]|nr:nucleoside hydrolase [Bacteroidales bacterium]